MNFVSKLVKLPQSKLIANNALRSICTSNLLLNQQGNKNLSNCPPPPPCCPLCGPYPKEVECKMNEHIALEFMAFYNYLAISNHFSRSDIGLKGIKHFFLNCAEDEKKHALKLCNYQTVRGGNVVLMDIEKPIKPICSVREAFCFSLQMEKKIAEKLNELKNCAHKCEDCVTHDFIVHDFMKEQYKSIHELTGYLAKVDLFKNNESGIYQFDKDLEDKFRKYHNDLCA